MIDHYIDAVASYAGSIDRLILLITVLVGFWFLLAEGIFFWLCFRYRARDGQKAGYVTGEEKHPKSFITTCHALVLVCDVFLIIGAIHVWYNVKQRLEPADETVRVIAQQWAWTFQHPGPDGTLDTEDDIRTVNELRLREGTTYHYELGSRDVLHSMSIPAFRLKHDAIPGRIVKGWFRPEMSGSYDLQCSEMCGIGHGLMPARVIIEPAAEHAAWMAERAPVVQARN
jgi:cytochrome c oxidase subunit 2